MEEVQTFLGKESLVSSDCGSGSIYEGALVCSQSHLVDLVSSDGRLLGGPARLDAEVSQSHLADLVSSDRIIDSIERLAIEKSQSHLADLVSSDCWLRHAVARRRDGSRP